MDQPPPELFGEFLKLPLPLRAECIHRVGEQEFAATTEYLRTTGLTVPDKFDRRLAWAVASNMGELPVTGAAGTAERTRQGVRSYQEWWVIDAPFADLWRFLTNPFWRSNPGHTSTLLYELTLSVLCERKDEWQDPPSRPIDERIANETFDYVYSTNNTLVVGYLRKKFPEGRLVDPEAIANEAWAKMYRTHWDPEASKRFLARCRISTLVCLFARYIALDKLRVRSSDQGRVERREDEGDDLGRKDEVSLLEQIGTTDSCSVEREEDGAEDLDAADSLDNSEGKAKSRRFSSEAIGIPITPQNELEAKELEQMVRKCLDQMPPKQRLVAYMIWFEKMRAKDVAECLYKKTSAVNQDVKKGISEAAVSEHLKKARQTLRRLLREHGVDVPSDEKKASTGRKGA
ncbi:MAG: sigma-70 family RNA polymerase sigma factor [Nitrospira sp.]|nr:sigma-70 family RNA polymerase sigma factor [Nitrospira sp.]